MKEKKGKNNKKVLFKEVKESQEGPGKETYIDGLEKKRRKKK
jgi:hypothetical protein